LFLVLCRLLPLRVIRLLASTVSGVLTYVWCVPADPRSVSEQGGVVVERMVMPHDQLSLTKFMGRGGKPHERVCLAQPER